MKKPMKKPRKKPSKGATLSCKAFVLHLPVVSFKSSTFLDYLKIPCAHGCELQVEFTLLTQTFGAKVSKSICLRQLHLKHPFKGDFFGIVAVSWNRTRSQGLCELRLVKEKNRALTKWLKAIRRKKSRMCELQYGIV